MSRLKKQLSLLFILLTFGYAAPVWAGCGAHDHNCFHGAFPNDPTLGPTPTGDQTLEFNTTYNNQGGTVDLNQHVRVPDNTGPYVGENPDGNPVTQAPLGQGPEVVYHNQQQVQFQSGTATGTLTTSPGAEVTGFIGNVSEGTYQHAVHNYDEDDLGNTGTYTTTVTAGGRGYFEVGAPSHVATAYIRSLGTSGTLGPDQVSPITEYRFRSNDFNPHANGVYVIPDGVWNIGGIPSNPAIGEPYQFEYANTRRSQDSVAVDFISHLAPLSSEADQEYGGWIYDANNGGFGLSLSVGNARSVDIMDPNQALASVGAGQNDISAMWHTHTQENVIAISNQDLYAADYYNVDSYIGTSISTGNISGAHVARLSNINTVFTGNGVPSELNFQLGVSVDAEIAGEAFGEEPGNSRGFGASLGFSTTDGRNMPGEHNTIITTSEITQNISYENIALGMTGDASIGMFIATDASVDPRNPNTTVVHDIDLGFVSIQIGAIGRKPVSLGIRLGLNPLPGYTRSTVTTRYGPLSGNQNGSGSEGHTGQGGGPAAGQNGAGPGSGEAGDGYGTANDGAI